MHALNIIIQPEYYLGRIPVYLFHRLVQVKISAALEIWQLDMFEQEKFNTFSRAATNIRFVWIFVRILVDLVFVYMEFM